jgi:spore coat polysaccharide biosynthesis predicted glycosyltransferase SpsG
MRCLFVVSTLPEKGLGHLVRCRDLARFLADKNIDCLFAVDWYSQDIATFLDDFQCIVTTRAADEVIRLIQSKHIATLIADHYSIDEAWEQQVAPHLTKLVVIDDVKRRHYCDVLIDFKWRGSNTASAYEGLTNPDAVHLLGPSYALMPALPGQAPARTELAPSSQQPSRIMVGHNFLSTAQVITLAAMLPSNVILMLVVGPHDNISVSNLQSCTNVEILAGKTELFSQLKNIDLYIGAAGGILYQLRALNIPMLSFSIADNQNSDIPDLEDIGHYFHLPSFNEEILPKVATCVGVFLQQHKRVKALGDTATVNVDTLGCERIYNAIYKNKIDNTTTKVTTKTFIPLCNGYELETVDDTHINRYLMARNHPKNQMRMIDHSEISKLDHYTWWFNTKRQSYLLYESNVPQLYIWHESVVVDDKTFLIGGWFVVEKETNFQSALVALQWQLKHCEEHLADTPWIAVIHKDNQFVQLLNKYLGFEEIPATHAYNSVCQSLFPHAESDEFQRVMKVPCTKKVQSS